MKSIATEKAHASISIEVDNNNTNTNNNIGTDNNNNVGTGNNNNAECIGKCGAELGECTAKYWKCFSGCGDSNKREGSSYDAMDIL